MSKKLLLTLFLILSLSVLSGCTKNESDQVIDGNQNKQTNDVMAEAMRKAQESIPADANLEEDKGLGENEFVVYRYYDPAEASDHLAADCSGNYQIKYVERTLKTGELPVIQAFKLLFSGDLTAEETAEGFFANPFDKLDFAIKNISFADGVLNIDLVDNEILTGFDECQGQVFSTVVFRTASQFDDVTRVKFTKYYDFKIKN